MIKTNRQRRQERKPKLKGGGIMLLEKLDFDQLKKMSLALNTATHEDEEGKEVLFLKTKLKTIAISKENLAKNFDAAIRSISDDVVNELPEAVIDFYNEFFSPEPAKPAEPEPEPEPTKPEPAEPKPTTKAEKAPKEKAPKEKAPKEKAPKEKKVGELSVFGHKLGSQAAALDDLLNTGVGISLEKLSEKSGRSPLGVKGHIKHLRTDRGLKIEEKNGMYILVK